MDIYKNQIKKLRNELHSNKKELKINKANMSKFEKYEKIFNRGLAGGAIVSIIIMVISCISTNMFPTYIASMICTAISGFIGFHFNCKYMSSISQCFYLNNRIYQIQEEIKNTHYFKLEKQRNKVIEEKGVNTLESIQKQIELLNEYKSRINGIYDNQIPEEVDKEIEYLEAQSKVFKLSK